MRILITGASGLIGRELAGILTERGHAVFALLHRSQGLSRNDGAALAAEPWRGAAPEAGQIVTVQGNVGLDGFGLNSASCALLASSLDLIVHCAAVTGFNLAPARYEQVNVGGAANVLAFAAHAGPMPIGVLLVSTAYVCGERSGVIEETPPATDHDFTNHYESSKAAAEHLALAAGRQGLPVAIARPSIVIGAAHDGAVGEFGGIYQLIRLLTDGRITSLPADRAASLDLVPIDYVVAGLADIAERMDRAAGGIFHLVSGAPVPLGLLHHYGSAYPHFRLPRLVAPERFDARSLTAREKLLHDQVTTLYAGYLKRDPRFCDARFRALTGSFCPPMGEIYLSRILDYCMQTGFLRSA